MKNELQLATYSRVAPSAQQLENTSNLFQEAINSLGKENAIPMKWSFFNNQETGKSKVYVTIGRYMPIAADANKLQLEKLWEVALTGLPQQVFPLSEEDMNKASEEDLQIVEDCRKVMLEKVINSGSYMKMRVYPYLQNPNYLDIRVNLLGAQLRFYINKHDEMAAMLRKGHHIL